MLTPALSYWQIAIGYVMYTFAPYTTELMLVLLHFVGLQYIVICSDKEHSRRVLKILEKDTYASATKHHNGKSLPSGYFIGAKCIGHYDNKHSYDSDDKIYILTTASYYKQLTADPCITHTAGMGRSVKQLVVEAPAETEKTKLLEDSDKKPQVQSIRKHWRQGQYKNFYYPSMKLDVSHINPIGDQVPIVDDIVKLYKKGLRAAVFISGISCAGKSSIGYLVAKALNGNYCHTFMPTDPGDQFERMFNEVSDRDDDAGPVILVMEEANELIRAVHNNTVRQIPEIPTPVYNKATWVTLLDDLVFYKRLVVILTSNEPKSAIDALDEAYLRSPGRIDASYEMKNKLSIDYD